VDRCPSRRAADLEAVRRRHRSASPDGLLRQVPRVLECVRLSCYRSSHPPNPSLCELGHHMDTLSRKTIHMGVNFVLAPMPAVDSHFSLAFQRFLGETGIEFGRVELQDGQLSIFRDKPAPLGIKIATGGPVGQLLIFAPLPERPLAAFVAEAEKVVRAFEIAASTGPRQLVSKDATLRDLFDTGGVHAFQEIWERFLERTPEVLAMLGKEVLGGGLRFVMPPREGELDPVQIELKIESFLRDTSKVFFETQFAWPQPSTPGSPIDPGALLASVDEYVQQVASRFAGETT